MKFAIIGCGHVAPSYASAFAQHPELELVGAFDEDASRCELFSKHYAIEQYPSLEALLADERVETVLNLTNPRRHFEVTHACLERGKHVYTEKPLGVNPEEMTTLYNFAKEKGLLLLSAPCGFLSETAQTIEHAIKSGLIGKPLLAYAQFDDGLIAPNQEPWTWTNRLGIPWPAKDEFEVGCTYEHAGYVLTWLARFFGPATEISSFASLQVPDKGIPVDAMAPDFSVGCLNYADGVVARVTCGLVAEFDKSLTIFGEKGVIRVANVRHERSPVKYRLYDKSRLASAIENRVARVFTWLKRPVPKDGWSTWRTYPYVVPASKWLHGVKAVDFLRGPADMARQIKSQEASLLSPEFCLHINEIVHGLQNPRTPTSRIESSFSIASETD